MNGTLQKILKSVQDRHSAPQKPHGLPLSTLEQMEDFENQDDEGYSQAVSDITILPDRNIFVYYIKLSFVQINYFHYVGGFHLKEAVQLCVKEALSDAFVRSFTWFGLEPGRRPLYNTRLPKAIYGKNLFLSRNKKIISILICTYLARFFFQMLYVKIASSTSRRDWNLKNRSGGSSNSKGTTSPKNTWSTLKK